MSYFLVRLVAFVTVSLFVYLLLPNFTRLDWVWSRGIYDAVSISIASSIVFAIIFGMTILVNAVSSKSPVIATELRRDTVFVLCFLIGAALFLFAPRPAGFSFGDSVGEIIDNGSLTAYGWRVQAKAFGRCLLVGVLFWAALRLWPMNFIRRQRHEEPK